MKPALKIAGLRIDIRMHLLRHAHASWLLNGGADLIVVKERLSHASIVTTEKYLHTLDNADETALAALDNIRVQRGWPSFLCARHATPRGGGERWPGSWIGCSNGTATTILIRRHRAAPDDMVRCFQFPTRASARGWSIDLRTSLTWPRR
ncbi:tyrosine-type recombinase/integrase [Glycomyces lechevalierae]|uniref:Tyrosine-type recombinase/integrase n=1 Tax=Glycomyces lechevalierae TaxID=256034 RepID=A0A9X3PUP3_9ACTN|nr:tyrosine-type recombinase/integrase [Glycomyces lechevalierae]MDA1386048.1 tyrosine-type recombinase/integrase [Glycomyces lechevalierae]